MIEDDIDKKLNELEKKDLIITDKNRSNVINDLEKNGLVVAKDIVEGSVVKIPDQVDLFSGFQEMLNIFMDKGNVYQLGHTDKYSRFEESILATIGDVPKFNSKHKRYDFVNYFRYHYNISSSADRGLKADQFKEIASSLLAFRSMLAMSQIRNPSFDDVTGKKGIKKLF